MSLPNNMAVINNVRFSYCNLFQAVSRNGQDPKYSTTILVPKADAQAKAIMDRAVNAAIDAGVSNKWNGQRPPKIDLCIHDGDGPRPSDGQPYGAECKGCWVLTASSKDAPFLRDAQLNNIIDPTQVYSGMWGNVCVTFFPYNSNGRKGIGCGLNGVQKVRDGEPLGNRVSAEDVFGVVESAAPAGYAQPQPASYGTTAYPQPAAPVYGAPTDYVQPAAHTQMDVDPITGQPVRTY